MLLLQESTKCLISLFKASVIICDAFWMESRLTESSFTFINANMLPRDRKAFVMKSCFPFLKMACSGLPWMSMLK